MLRMLEDLSAGSGRLGGGAIVRTGSAGPPPQPLGVELQHQRVRSAGGRPGRCRSAGAAASRDAGAAARRVLGPGGARRARRPIPTTRAATAARPTGADAALSDQPPAPSGASGLDDGRTPRSGGRTGPARGPAAASPGARAPSPAGRAPSAGQPPRTRRPGVRRRHGTLCAPARPAPAGPPSCAGPAPGNGPAADQPDRHRPPGEQPGRPSVHGGHRVEVVARRGGAPSAGRQQRDSQHAPPRAGRSPHRRGPAPPRRLTRPPAHRSCVGHRARRRPRPGRRAAPRRTPARRRPRGRGLPPLPGDQPLGARRRTGWDHDPARGGGENGRLTVRGPASGHAQEMPGSAATALRVCSAGPPSCPEAAPTTPSSRTVHPRRRTAATSSTQTRNLGRRGTSADRAHRPDRPSARSADRPIGPTGPTGVDTARRSPAAP